MTLFPIPMDSPHQDDPGPLEEAKGRLQAIQAGTAAWADAERIIGDLPLPLSDRAWAMLHYWLAGQTVTVGGDVPNRRSMRAADKALSLAQRRFADLSARDSRQARVALQCRVAKEAGKVCEEEPRRKRK